MLKLYGVKNISGSTTEEVFAYYAGLKNRLKDFFDIFLPLYGKKNLRTEIKFRAEGQNNSPLTTNHAIFNRDRWMVKQADVVYANFLGAKIVSIGSMFELAWAKEGGKHIVVVMEKNNIHRHAFVLEAADVIFEDTDSAIFYLRQIANKDF